MRNGKEIFNQVFGDCTEEFATVLEKRSPGMSEKAIYSAYEQFYAKQGELALQTRMLVTIASLVSQNNLTDFNFYVSGALNVGCSPVQISETILQMGIYVGEPSAQNAMESFQEVLERKEVDLTRAYADASAAAPAELSSGDAIFRRLFGDEKAAQVYAFLRELSPSLDEFAIAHPFGQFYAKEHLLDLKIRELATIASLVTTGMLPQLKLHIGAALYIGCSLVQIEQVLLQMGAYAGNPRMLNAMKVFQKVQEERAASDAGLRAES